MIVQKFGGSSLADGERVRRAAELVGGPPEAPVVVVSAPGGFTNRLLELCDRAEEGQVEEVRAGIRELAERTVEMARDALDQGDGKSATPALVARLRARLDRTEEELVACAGLPGTTGPARRDSIVATGEDISVELMVAALRCLGRDARAVDAREAIRTDSQYGRAGLDEEATVEALRSGLVALRAEGVVPVLQGFVGSGPDGSTTTLGRGGGDYTAAIVGAVLEAERVDIWTDVDGIFSADPRQVHGARTLPEVGYEEAVELAHFGARVIHPGAAKHAVSRGVPVRIRNTFRPDRPGTLIRMDRRGSAAVAAVAAKAGTILIKVRAFPSSIPYGFLARVFEVLARHEVPVDLVATSHSSTAFTLDQVETDEVGAIGAVAEELSDFAEVEVVRDLATLTVVGSGLLAEPGLAGRVFWVVGKTPVHLISQASDVSLSFLVDGSEAEDLVRRLHEMLIEWPEKGGTP